MNKLIEYLTARASEPSTWVSLGAMFTGLGWNISPEHWQSIAGIGLGVGGLLGSILRERKKTTVQEIKNIAVQTVEQNVQPTALK